MNTSDNRNMKKPDLLKEYIRELPREEPSVNFTEMVMSRVNVETLKFPVAYQPLIGSKGWRNIIFLLTGVLLGSIVLYFYFPTNQSASGLFLLPKIDYSIFIKPFVLFSQSLNKLSFSLSAVVMAVSTLLIIDQIHSRKTQV
ncbi:MAG: hypothetical protein WCI31_01400 [Prolixibacteraceae bacterium]